MARVDALTHCYRCDASYDGGVVWVRGFRTGQKETTLGGFIPFGGQVKPGHCPFCDKPPQLEPDPVQHAM